MKMDVKQLTFCPVPIETSSEKVDFMAKEALNCPEEFWYYNSFRKCSMLPLYTSKGHMNRDKISQSREGLAWTRAADHCPSIKLFVESKLFALLRPMGRVFIIRTAAKSQMNVHIDCSQKKFNSLVANFKYRFVLKGPLESLFFIDENKEMVFINKEQYRSYVIDGRVPHGMVNNSDEVKLTLCVGEPWSGESSYFLNILLENSKQWRHIKTLSKVPKDWVDPRFR